MALRGRSNYWYLTNLILTSLDNQSWCRSKAINIDAISCKNITCTSLHLGPSLDTLFFNLASLERASNNIWKWVLWSRYHVGNITIITNWTIPQLLQTYNKQHLRKNVAKVCLFFKAFFYWYIWAKICRCNISFLPFLSDAYWRWHLLRLCSTDVSEKESDRTWEATQGSQVAW